jgi:hypothetical protein
MQRYYFHFLTSGDAVFDPKGVELADFAAAYDHACALVQEIRDRLPEADDTWWIEINDGIAAPTSVLPTMVPRARTSKPRASPKLAFGSPKRRGDSA